MLMGTLEGGCVRGSVGGCVRGSVGQCVETVDVLMSLETRSLPKMCVDCSQG